MPFAKAVGYLLGRSSHESGQRNDRDTAREKYESVCTRPKMLKVERDERVQRQAECLGSSVALAHRRSP